MLNLKPFVVIFFFVLLIICYTQKISLSIVLPNQILEESLIEYLRDEVYYFPAHRSPSSEIVYLPLRRWDIIFVGNDLDLIEDFNDRLDEFNISAAIPGIFDHIMVYLGKDDLGFAYVAELTIFPSYDKSVNYLKLFNFGLDYGYLMPPISQSRIAKDENTIVWAKTFKEDLRLKLKQNEDKLLRIIKHDLISRFPYQLEFKHSGNIFDTNVYLVDDGREGGSSCSDYWISLFEEFANICFYNIRIKPDELYEYFLNDKYGSKVVVPSEISSAGAGISIKELIALGFKIVPDKPHVFKCNPDIQEIGLIIPQLIYNNENLMDIPEIHTKKSLVDVFRLNIRSFDVILNNLTSLRNSIKL